MTGFPVNEAAFKKLISGSRRGVLPAMLRGGLSLFSPFYRFAVGLRNRAFDFGLKKTHHASVPVISVGNITTGGTGKTPIVAFLANWFRECGVDVALLSRGYGALENPAVDTTSSPGERTNDEKLVLEKLCPGVPHLQNPDRVKSAKTAVEQHGSQLLILDDGFQHRRLHRDLDIVLIDALNPFGYGRLLPRGLLREPLAGLRRASLILLTRADQCTAVEKKSILQTVRRIAPECGVVEVAFRSNGLVNSNSETQSISTLKDQPVTAFCGIGNPESFRRTLSEYDVREFRAFPDHHHYTPADLEQIAAAARNHQAESVVVTLKDLVKINRPEIGNTKLWAVNLTSDIIQGSELLDNKLASFASSTADSRPQ